MAIKIIVKKSEFADAMNVTDEQFAHNMKVWERENRKFEIKKMVRNEMRKAEEEADKKRFVNKPFAKALKSVRGRKK
jgi:hypothetical protein